MSLLYVMGAMKPGAGFTVEPISRFRAVASFAAALTDQDHEIPL